MSERKARFAQKLFKVLELMYAHDSQCLALAREFAAEFPNNCAAISLLAGCENSHGNSNEALKLYRQAVEIGPKFMPAATNYVSLLNLFEMYDEIVNEMCRYLALAQDPFYMRTMRDEFVPKLPQDKQELLKKRLKKISPRACLKLFRPTTIERHSRAYRIADWEKVFKEKPAPLLVLEKLRVEQILFLYEHDDARCLELAQEFADEQPDDCVVVSLLGSCQFCYDRSEDAVETMEKCVELNPKFFTGSLNYAYMLNDLERYEDLIEEVCRYLGLGRDLMYVERVREDILPEMPENTRERLVGRLSEMAVGEV